MSAQLVVASNRGPMVSSGVSAVSDDSRPGGGGLLTILGSALPGTGGVWIVAAPGEAPTIKPTSLVDLPSGRLALRKVPIDMDVYSAYYGRVATQTLWFLHHHMVDLVRSVDFGPSFRDDWRSFEHVNEMFASACGDESALGATVVLQDYHLAVAPALLRAKREDVRIVHCTMCPWADPEYFATVPEWLARKLIGGMLGADVLSFFVPRWQLSFLRCCANLGYDVDWKRSAVHQDGRLVLVRAFPVGVDPAHLDVQMATEQVDAEISKVASLTAGMQLVLRVDRLDPSKNILRGIAAYGEFLAAHPELHSKVLHYVLAYASRTEIPEYQIYATEVNDAVEKVNRSYGTETWQPILLDSRNNIDRALALMAQADVLIVNALRDGMNLIAKEAAVVSRHDVVVILSRDTGAADDLASGALIVDPRNVSELAEAIAVAFTFTRQQRRRRLELLRAGAVSVHPRRWLELLVDAARRRPITT